MFKCKRKKRKKKKKCRNADALRRHVSLARFSVTRQQNRGAVDYANDYRHVYNSIRRVVIARRGVFYADVHPLALAHTCR